MRRLTILMVLIALLLFALLVPTALGDDSTTGAGASNPLQITEITNDVIDDDPESPLQIDDDANELIDLRTDRPLRFGHIASDGSIAINDVVVHPTISHNGTLEVSANMLRNVQLVNLIASEVPEVVLSYFELDGDDVIFNGEVNLSVSGSFYTFVLNDGTEYGYNSISVRIRELEEQTFRITGGMRGDEALFSIDEVNFPVPDKPGKPWEENNVIDMDFEDNEIPEEVDPDVGSDDEDEEDILDQIPKVSPTETKEDGDKIIITVNGTEYELTQDQYNQFMASLDGGE